MVDKNCTECYGTGEIVRCGWCMFGVPHSSCDDTYRDKCFCCEDSKSGKERMVPGKVNSLDRPVVARSLPQRDAET